MAIHIEELIAELKAIYYWDLHYERQTSHDFGETSAWLARQQRLDDIFKKLENAGLSRLRCVTCLQDQIQRRLAVRNE